MTGAGPSEGPGHIFSRRIDLVGKARAGTRDPKNGVVMDLASLPHPVVDRIDAAQVDVVMGESKSFQTSVSLLLSAIKPHVPNEVWLRVETFALGIEDAVAGLECPIEDCTKAALVNIGAGNFVCHEHAASCVQCPNCHAVFRTAADLVDDTHCVLCAKRGAPPADAARFLARTGWEL